MKEVATYVQENEPGTLRYEVNRTLRPDKKDGTEDLVMLERYVLLGYLKAILSQVSNGTVLYAVVHAERGSSDIRTKNH